MTSEKLEQFLRKNLGFRMYSQMWNKNLKVIVLALTVDEDVLYIPNNTLTTTRPPLFVQNAKLRIFESPKSRMASVHQVECHAPSRRAPSTLG